MGRTKPTKPKSKSKTAKKKRTATTTKSTINKPYAGKTLIIEKELRNYCRKQGDLTYGELLANGDDWGGASILLAIPALSKKYNYDRDDISNSLRTLRRHHSNGHSMLDKPAAKKSNAKTSKSKKKSVSTPKNNTSVNSTSKYIGQRVSSEWDKESFTGIVSHDDETDELVLTYDDGSGEEVFSSEEDMINEGKVVMLKEKQSQKKKKRKRAVEEEAPAASTSNKRTTHNSKRGKSAVEEETPAASRATRTSKRVKSGSDNNKKGGDDVPPTSPTSSTKSKEDGDKENGALDTNDKEGEKEDSSPSKESDLEDGAADKGMQSSDEGGGMQSPAKSTGGGDVLQTVTTGLANDISEFAVGVLNEAMEKDQTDNITPLQNEISSTKDQITISVQAMERIALLLASKESLPPDFNLGIDISNSDKDKEDNTQLVKALENKLLEMEPQLERFVSNTPARKQFYISIIQKELELQAADNFTAVPLLTEGSDNNAITTETGDNDETNGVAPWLITRCQGMVQGIIQGVLKQLYSIKSKELEAAYQSQYEETVTPLRKKEERYILVHKHNVAVNALDLIDKGAKSFPGSEEDYWNEFQDEYDSLKKKKKRYKKEYHALYKVYVSAVKKFVEGMNRYDEHLQKAFTIKIGSADIKPPLEQLRVDDEGAIVRVDDGSGSGEDEDE